MNCKNCGCALDSGAEICYACGTPVDAPKPEREPYSLEDPAAEASLPEEQTADTLAAVNVDNAQKAGRFARIVSFLFALVGLILFGVQRKNGEDAKAVSIADSIMAGFCAKMAVALCYLLIGIFLHR